MIRVLTGLTLILASLGAHAALHGRLPATQGGTDYQAYYDDRLNITWIADGNLAATRPFGVSGMGTSTSGYGAMSWDTAQAWVTAMNAAGYLGVSDWRLPNVIDTDGPDPDTLGGDGRNLSYSGTDCGWNVDPATGELAHLYYVTLGNVGGYDPNGVHQDWCDTGQPAPPACLTNVGPFSNFFPNHYWTGTAFAPDTANAWELNARIGLQNIVAKTRMSYVWAVRNGDIDADGDGVAQSHDNCTLVANPEQSDGDHDGYGNRCDGDLNNNGVTNTQDFAIFRPRFGTSDAAADLNGDGTVNAPDYGIFRTLLSHPPGPSGLHPSCPPTCP